MFIRWFIPFGVMACQYNALHKLHSLMCGFLFVLALSCGRMAKKNGFLTKIMSPIIERLLIASYSVYLHEKESADSGILDYERFALAVKCKLETTEA